MNQTSKSDGFMPTEAGDYEFRGILYGGEWCCDKRFDEWSPVMVFFNIDSQRLNGCISDEDGVSRKDRLAAFKGEWRRLEDRS